MEYNLWKSVLLDWVNSTGFLVQNYQNLGDTNIDTFFIAFKKQIKSTRIQSENVVSFIREYYKDFYLKLDQENKVPISEYVYFYSMFLHFACVLHADEGVQQICNNMVRKNQEMIEKFLDYLFKIGKCERAIVQTAIEEAESCDLPIAHVSPITRNIQSILSSTSPQTPKSKLLNTWNLENRNLKSQLETERFERGYLEMQLNQCEKKLTKLDDDYKIAMTENNLLKKQIQMLDENDQLTQNAEIDSTVKQLRREINQKEDELFKLTSKVNAANDDIELLQEKLQYAETQVKSLNVKLLDSFNEAETFKSQLDDREKMINYLNTSNKELSDMLKELQSNSKKLDFDSSSSYDLLNSTANDLNTSSFCVPEENLASAVVDVRLIDQQKQNMALSETINQLKKEISVLHDDASKLYATMMESDGNDIDLSSSINEIFAKINKTFVDMAEKKKEFSQKIESHCAEIDLLKEQTCALQSKINALNERLQEEEKENANLLSQNHNITVELENIKTTLATCEAQKSALNASLSDVTAQLERVQSEKRELISQHSDEMSKIRTELEEKIATLNVNLNEQAMEKNGIQTKLEQVQTELDETMDLLAKHKLEIDEITSELNAEKASREEVQKDRALIETKYTEVSQKFEQIEIDLGEARSKNDEITSELNEKKKELSEKIESHCAEIASLKEQTSTLQSTIDSLNERIQLEEKEKTDLLSQNKNASVELENLKATLETCETKKSELNATLSDVSAQLEQVQSEKRDLIAQHLEEVRRIQTEFEEKISTVNANLDTQTNEKNKMQTKLDQVQTELDETMDSLANLKLELAEVSSQLSDETSTRNRVQKKFTEIEAKCAEISEKLQDTQKTLTETLVKKEEIESELTAKNAEMSKLNVELSESQKKILDMENTITSNNEKSQSEKSELQSKIAALNERLQQEEKEKADLIGQNQNTAVEIENLKTTLVTYETQRLQLNTSLLDVTAQLEQVQSEKRELISQHSDEMSKIRTELEEKIATLSNNLDEQVKEKNGIQTKLEQVQTELDETMDLLAKHKFEIDEITSELNAEKASREEVQKDRALIETKYTEISQKFEQIEKDLSDARSKNDEINSDLNEKNDRIFKLMDDLSQSATKVAELENTITSNDEKSQTEKRDLIAQHLEEVRRIQTEFEEKLGAVNANLDTQTNEKNEIQTKLDQVQTELEETMDSLAKHKLELAETTNQLNDETSTRNRVQKEFTEVEAKCAEISEKLQDTQKTLTETVTKKDEIEAELTAKNAEMSKLNVELSESQKKILDMENTITSNNEKSQSEKCELISQHSDEMSQLRSELEEKIATLNVNLNEQAMEKNGIQTKLEQVQAELDETMDLLAKHKLEIDEITSELNAEKASREEVQKDRALIETKYTEVSQKFEQIEIDLGEARSKNDEITSELNEKKKELSEKIESHCAEIASLKEQTSTLQSTIDSLNERIQLEEKEKTDLLSQNKNASVELENLKATLATYEAQKSELQVSLLEVSAQLERVQSEKRELMSQHLEEVRLVREENKMLIETATNKEQVLSLNEQLVQMEKIQNEKVELWKKEKESLIHDVKIYRAKLMKERETVDQKDKEFKTMRNIYEEKLEKMKEKMKTLYKEEMAKVQEKHEKQLAEIVTENRRYSDKLIFYDEKNKEFSSQIHALNEEKLILLKEHEIMKTKLRTYEIGSTLNGGNTGASKFLDKMRGGTFRMEDEEGELFDNTYLDELKRGGATGRESLTLDEIQRRNSMLPPHLRSSYMPQFAENDLKINENFKPSLDDSMFSTQSETRRGTAYKRPGPPTPSKNSGRLSLGSEFLRNDVLREHNGIERPSLGGNTSKAKKSTPGKLTRIFSSSKLKDEDKENDHHYPHTGSRSTLHHLQKLFFSTSTPHRNGRRSSAMAKFERTGSLGFVNHSVSTIDSKISSDPMRFSTLSRSILAQTKKVSQKFLCTNAAANYESTPEYDKRHRDTTTLATSRKSFLKKRSSLLRKRIAHNKKTQKEKRHSAYNRFRRISKTDHSITDETFSIGSGNNISGATFDVERSESPSYDSDIRDFQAEVNEFKGLIEIFGDECKDEVDFEKLCNVKESNCPFENKEKVSNLTVPQITFRKSPSKSNKKGEDEISSDHSKQSINSNRSSTSPTRMSSHCARICWNQQKIPKITTYKAERKSLENDSQNSTRSHHNTQTLITTVRSIHSNVTVGWFDIPQFIRYYIVSVTVLFIALLRYQFS